MRLSYFGLPVLIILSGIVGCGSGESDSAETTTAPVEEVETELNESSETETASAEPAPEGKVLRHAVFFSFKEESSESDVQEVVDAFRALPEKIDAIQDFAWGTNNSPEGLDDGFTHCFFLTFKDQAGLQEYIPHPAHSGEFADVLRPHMKSVFVIDYWGTPSEAELEKELMHAVFFKFKDDADPAAVKEVEEAFAALPNKIDAVKAFEWGMNNSPEGKNDGFTHAFMLTFDSEDGRKAYLPHPDHQAFVKVLEPVLDKVRVLDFWAVE
ncbi:MAG: Dabb family protein [Planctomycetota bacterium]